MNARYINTLTNELPVYPMEKLHAIKSRLLEKGQPVYDFGTGDPRIPIWPTLTDAIKEYVPTMSQYPTIAGIKELKESHLEYLKRRYQVDSASPYLDVIPTRGSKEAIFHIAMSLIERKSKRNKIIYPTPGYPVYRSSILFAGGRPEPVTLTEENNYLLEPWKLEEKTLEGVCAIWINYPHNPTGATVTKDYWQQMVDWCHQHDVVLLADECYGDIYTESSDTNALPMSPLAITSDRVLSFFSLSKRSGLTGFRVGFMAGDKGIITAHKKARSNFGLGCPEFLQKAAVVAWNDDSHVAKRRKIFSHRVMLATHALKDLGIIDVAPQATFYLWCRVPKRFSSQNDVDFCLQLAEKGVVTMPSSWLGEGTTGYFRLALVPEDKQTEEAMNIIKDFVTHL